MPFKIGIEDLVFICIYVWAKLKNNFMKLFQILHKYYLQVGSSYYRLHIYYHVVTYGGLALTARKLSKVTIPRGRIRGHS